MVEEILAVVFPHENEGVRRVTVSNRVREIRLVASDQCDCTARRASIPLIALM